MLIFDNVGGLSSQGTDFGGRLDRLPQGSRVLEYDPQTQAFPWFYPDPEEGTPFFSPRRGMCQRLPNGNTLIVNSEGNDSTRGQIFEVSPSKEVVWSCSCDGYIHTARRYSPAQVPFLK
jgi:hypothetical protein